MSGNFYRAFEDRYRGSRELIKDRLTAYAPFTRALAGLHPGAPVLDLGCGRGEWLELMTEEGFDASGVDLDDGMLAACRERGLKVRTADALSTLKALPDASVAMVSAFHLVEHLPFDDAQTIIAETLRVLMPGGLLIMETPNPENLIVGTNNFYLDPSHLKPIPPILLDFMAEYAGFDRHRIVRLPRGETPENQAVGLRQVLQDVSADYGVVAQKGDAALLADFSQAFDASYGATLDVIAERFDQRIARLHGDIEAWTVANNAHGDEHGRILQGLDKANAELWNRALPSLEQGMAALATRVEQVAAEGDAGALASEERLAQALARMEQFKSEFDGRLTDALARIEQANADALTTSQATEARLVDAMARIDQVNADALATSQAAESRLSDAMARIEQVNANAMATSQATETRLNEAVARLEQRTGERFQHSERRQAQADRRAAPLSLRLEQAEAAVAATATRAQHAEEHAKQLQQQMDAFLASSSWRITAPARWLVGVPRRLVLAVREDRIKSGLRRRLTAAIMPLLGSAHPEADTGLRGWIRRSKEKTWLRRIVLPMLQRFPQLRTPLRRLAGIAAPSVPPSGDIMLPDWPGPLPAEYLAMTPSSRKVLLDLAQAQYPSSHP